tara:strand:+ start:1843 stop:1947 length:105 start_codon:yes stop_codon:yes gene_type:complete
MKEGVVELGCMGDRGWTGGDPFFEKIPKKNLKAF